ncbi:MAG: FecR family protein [Bacteroidota bacterium]|nr:FecR family protein [Bacteroidota bacterium]
MRTEDKNWDIIISKLHGELNKKTDLPESDPDFENQFKDALKIKRLLKRVFLFDNFDKEAAKEKLGKELNFKKKETPLRNLRLSFLRAAVILLIFITGAFIYSISSHFPIKPIYSEIIVPVGQTTKVNLSDGTQVWLSSGTKFKYPATFDRTKRDVYIDGEALFKVTHDKHNPFIVHAGSFNIRVLGTTFNVIAYSSEKKADVMLIKGSVALEEKNKNWEKKMKEGEVATIANEKNPPIISNMNNDFYSAWEKGEVVFKKEKLEEIVQKLERWYNVKFEFKNPELKNLVFSGTFLKNKPIELVFESLTLMNENIAFISGGEIGGKKIIYIKKIH